MKRQLLFYSLLLPLAGGAAMAQTVSQEVASVKALQFINQVKRAQGSNSNQQLQLAHKAQQGDETYFYVFNYGQDQGYVIVGGDEAAREILGYGEKGNFDYQNLPPQMKWWLSQYEAQISEVIGQVKAGKLDLNEAKKQNRTMAAKSNVAPLLGGIKWDQVAPFNSMIPGNIPQPANIMEEYATGCVATAMAQVMKMWNYPERGIGIKSYKSNGVTYEAFFGGTTYDWAHMTNTYAYDKYSGTVAEDAVATLMYHAGVAVSTDYDIMDNGGSGAFTANVATALKTYFAYDPSVHYEQRSTYSDAVWEQMVYNDLAAGQPVIYGGQDKYSEAGHCFVCDGYQSATDMYHINWGWSGSSNDYFVLTSTTVDPLAPDGTGSGGAAIGASYSRGQEAVFGVKPDPTNEGVPYMAEAPVIQNNGYATIDDPFTVKFTYSNPTSSDVEYEQLVLLVFPSEGGYNVDAKMLTNVIIPAGGDKEIVFTFPEFDASKMQVGKDYFFELMDYKTREYISGDYPLYIKAHKPVTATVTDAGWRTICLPYEAEPQTGWSVYEVTDVNGTELVKNEVTHMEMNTPYLVKAPAGNYNFDGPNTPLGLYTNGLLTGNTYSLTKYAPKGSYVLQQHGSEVAFYEVAAKNTQKVTQYTAYLTAPSGSPARLSFDDETTAITTVEQENAEQEVLYNVAGQRVNNAKGLVIKNGKLNFNK